MLRPITPETAARFCALVIAEAGTGKTSLIRTILGQRWAGKDEAGRDIWQQWREPLGVPYVISAESGLLAVRDCIAAGMVAGVEVETWQDLKDVFHYLATDGQAQQAFNWIVIDSLTEIGDKCLRSTKERHSDSNNGWELWGDYGDEFGGLIKSFRDLHQYNVIFTCLPKTEKDEMNRRFTGADITGKSLQNRLVSFFDLVLYMKTYEQEGQRYRVLHTQPHETYPAKDRSGKLAAVEAPCLATIHDKILGGF